MSNLDKFVDEGNILSFSEIQDASNCVVCSDISDDHRLLQCEHGHQICSICHGSIHTHGSLTIKLHKQNEEECYKYDSGYFETTNDQINYQDDLQGALKVGLVRMTLDNRDFVGVCWRDAGRFGLWRMSLYIVGTSGEAKHYIFKVKICDPNCVEELSYTAECVPLHMGRKEIITMGRCLTFNDEIVKRFSFHDKLSFYFEILAKPKGYKP